MHNADITIFNPETVKDNATYKAGANGLPSTGIPYVIVNGTIVVKDSKVLKGVYPGQPIRYAVQSKGRFKPLVKESYLKAIMGVNYVDLDDEALGKEAKQ